VWTFEAVSRSRVAFVDVPVNGSLHVLLPVVVFLCSVHVFAPECSWVVFKQSVIGIDLGKVDCITPLLGPERVWVRRIVRGLVGVGPKEFYEVRASSKNKWIVNN